MKKIFLSLADRSASNYVYEILKEGFEEYEIYGLTDEKLEKIGVKSVARYSEISTVGLIEALPKVFKFLKIYRKILKNLKNTDTLIACDAPALNLRLIKDARKLGVKRIIYFISPQVWAWKPKRAEIIANYCDHVIVILPFEKKIYRKFPNLKVHYVGHPLVDLVKPQKTKEEFMKAFKKEPLPLLLGSREGEIRRHVKLLKGIIEELKKSFDVISPTFREFSKFIERELKVKTLTYEGASYDCFFYSKASLIASGTASLEAGIAGNPHVVYYKVNPITYFLGKRLVKVPYISLVNILLKEEVVPEFIQKSSDEILKGFEKVYKNEEEIKEKLGTLKFILGERFVIRKLRELFLEIV
ncbi:lipid-A-disaccharide synthase [Aquifex aeolicus]|uniref:Lipid-A-disaccharide synthase n=1 Tax=Aquifex aeolicus (strain VF5) TaxID=224324 RepID=LPXB_AQUAE|nr:lipid-A-disaccharide synthase [Aquifex aeolicus]O67420.1 RecName: Full=Lipid-A-disaccharide synthase [Aquifex aeolicus VF5]AAC07386.1 lipid A disaccharide synthetase [Aquifex aeolicus VF5]